MIRTHKKPSNKIRASAMVIVFGALGIIVGLVGWPSARMGTSSKSPQDVTLHSTNKTAALQVVDLKRIQKGVSTVEVTLLNVSDKNITAFVLLVGSSGILTDLVLSDGGALAPGKQRVESIAFGNFEAAAAKDPSRAGELIVSAVTFEGGDGEGQSQHLQMIGERHRGAKEQITLMLPLLQRKINSSDTDPDKLLLELDSLSSPAGDSNISIDRKEARESAKEALISELKMLEKWSKEVPNSDYLTSLTRLTGRYDMVLGRLKLD